MTVSKDVIITKANPHTIKKFELITKYIEAWSQKLMLNKYCNGLIFIDCMCNSGVYEDQNGKLIYGTPIRVAKVLLDVARTYTNKMVNIYFNDLNKKRVRELEKYLPENERNFKIITSSENAVSLLEHIGPQLSETSHYNYFLLYDPYDARIDWKVLLPFFRHWGEVMINHALLDPVRAITSAKSNSAIEKYEHTYLTDFENLVPYGSDKKAYEKRISQILNYMKGNRRYYIASFPFYNSKNSLQYDLIHCTSNIEGYKLYKNCAWKVFGGKSSTKKINSQYIQLEINFDEESDSEIDEPIDEGCYTIHDIAGYLQHVFSGQKKVPLDRIWGVLAYHPIFPSGVFRNEIKNELFQYYQAQRIIEKDILTGKRRETISFVG